MKILKLKNLFMMIIPIGLSILLASCDEERTPVQFRTAEGYSVLNSIKNDGGYEKEFTTQEDFDKYFGKATTMSASPTPINFEKEFAAAFIAPLSNMETTINVDSVIWNGRQTEMYLSIETGDTLNQQIRPVKIILIDKQYEGKLTSFVTSYEPKRK